MRNSVENLWVGKWLKKKMGIREKALNQRILGKIRCWKMVRKKKRRETGAKELNMKIWEDGEEENNQTRYYPRSIICIYQVEQNPE